MHACAHLDAVDSVVLKVPMVRQVEGLHAAGAHHPETLLVKLWLHLFCVRETQTKNGACMTYILGCPRREAHACWHNAARVLWSDERTAHRSTSKKKLHKRWHRGYHAGGRTETPVSLSPCLILTKARERHQSVHVQQVRPPF